MIPHSHKQGFFMESKGEAQKKSLNYKKKKKYCARLIKNSFFCAFPQFALCEGALCSLCNNTKTGVLIATLAKYSTQKNCVCGNVKLLQ